MPLVSVVLPSLNGASRGFLNEAVRSILNQSVKDFELILVDDGSSDETGEIFENWRQQDSRIKVIHHSVNEGIPASLNDGFSISTGILRSWTSDDNLFYPYAFEKMIKVLDNNKNAIMTCCYTEVFHLKTGKRKIQKNLDFTPLASLKKCPVGACFLYRASVEEKIGGYSNQYPLAQDYEYWLRVRMCGEIVTSEYVGCRYLAHEGQLTSKKSDQLSLESYNLQLEYSSKYANIFRETASYASLLQAVNKFSKNSTSDIKPLVAQHSKRDIYKLFCKRYRATRDNNALHGIELLGLLWRFRFWLLKMKGRA